MMWWPCDVRSWVMHVWVDVFKCRSTHQCFVQNIHSYRDFPSFGIQNTMVKLSVFNSLKSTNSLFYCIIFSTDSEFTVNSTPVKYVFFCRGTEDAVVGEHHWKTVQPGHTGTQVMSLRARRRWSLTSSSPLLDVMGEARQSKHTLTITLLVNIGNPIRSTEVVLD